MTVFNNVSENDLGILKRLKFVPSSPKTIYEVIRYKKKGVIAIYYDSGKLFLQGNQAAVDKVADHFRKSGAKEKVKESFRQEKGWIIGSDEALKGDTFGGLVVAAVKADDDIRKKLLELGVADSKALSDSEVLRLADEIKKLAQSEIISYLPEEYNSFHGNQTELLDKLHSSVAKDLGAGKHVVDKYPGCEAGDLAVVKAEQKYVEVAAASILARATGLRQLQYLGNVLGFEVPKGSTHVRDGLEKLRGKDYEKFVKIKFRNVVSFLSG